MTNPEIAAAAANDAYKNRSRNDVEDKAKFVYLGGEKYDIFGYKDDYPTGFHATAYREVAFPHNIIIAYRGTDPDIKGHTLTTFQDAAVDATMVRDQVNPQKQVADEFTAKMIEKATARGLRKDQITVAGHSLGGTLAEVEAARFGLRGATFNGYGAVGLGYNVPEGGGQVSNYVMACDVVSAANRHYGHVIPLASAEDIDSLRKARYLDAATGSRPPNPLLAMRPADHSVTHFAPDPGSKHPSVLMPALLARYQQNYADNKSAFDLYRSDIQRERAEIAQVMRQAAGRQDRTTPNPLPRDVREHLDEYLAVHADPSIHNQVEQNHKVLFVELGLQRGADVVLAGTRYLHEHEERAAAIAQKAGAFIAPVAPLAPLAGAVLGAVAHLQGDAIGSAGDFTASQLQSARHGVAQDAHRLAEAGKAVVHSPKAHEELLVGANLLISAYQSVEVATLAGQRTVEGVRRNVAKGIDAMERGVERVRGTTTGVVSGAEEAAESMTKRVHAALNQASEMLRHETPSLHARVGTSPTQTPDQPTSPARSSPPRDPRHPGNTDHPLFDELHRRIPAASQARLLQFTAACQASRISAGSLSLIHLDETNMQIAFHGSDLMCPPAIVNLGVPPPHVTYEHHPTQPLPSFPPVPTQDMSIGSTTPER